ncbi:MAG: hypothetical protein AAB604_00220 [Patescibacteria group bacterium]
MRERETTNADEIITVSPKTIQANGLMPLFSSKKAYGIECGKCGRGYRDKVFCVSDDASSRCPLCSMINRWSHASWMRHYIRIEKQEEQEKTMWLESNVPKALASGFQRVGNVANFLNELIKKQGVSFFVYDSDVQHALSQLVKRGVVKKKLWWYTRKEVNHD